MKKAKQIIHIPGIFVALLLISHFTFGQSADSVAKTYLGVLTLTEKYTQVKNWTPSDQAIVTEHFNRLVKFKNEGVVIMAGRTQYQTDNPDMMGLVVFRARNNEEAERFMTEDPAVKNSIMKLKVHPYDVAIDRCI